MAMPAQLSLPVQRGLRTIISGVMLVQCFTVYVYLASYIVLLYPIFLEERPALVLPWLLLAAVRKFLCELTSLALGLGVCVLMGPAKPSCIRFVIFKVASIIPAFYMWMLVYSYYTWLKVTLAFKMKFSALVSMPSDQDYGLELAVRRRRTKSLQDENQLRRKLVASLSYGENLSASQQCTTPDKPFFDLSKKNAIHHDIEEIVQPTPDISFIPLGTDQLLDVGLYEDWCGSEITVPRDSDRILEQFALMMLRVGAFIQTKGVDLEKLFSSHSQNPQHFNNMDCSTSHMDSENTSPLVSTKGKTASYLQNYPQIFNKKPPETLMQDKDITNEKSLRTIDKFESASKNSTNMKETRLTDQGTSKIMSQNSEDNFCSLLQQKETALKRTSHLVDLNNKNQPTTSTRANEGFNSKLRTSSFTMKFQSDQRNQDDGKLSQRVKSEIFANDESKLERIIKQVLDLKEVYKTPHRSASSQSKESESSVGALDSVTLEETVKQLRETTQAIIAPERSPDSHLSENTNKNRNLKDTNQRKNT